MQIDLRGRGALITGSTRGIGAAVAEAYARCGADVVIHGRDAASLTDDLLDRCRRHGVRVHFLTADLAGPVTPTVDRLFSEAIAACPHLDILVNNAGGHQGEGRFLDVAPELFERTVRLHATAPFFLTQRFARHWIASQRPGCVIMVGSVNGQLAERGSSAYDTSKGAQLMLVRTLAAELARQNVRVNGFAPGMVLTDRTQWAVEDPERGRWVKHNTPNGLLPGPDSCVGAALFLASPEAYHVHGQMLMVDGGMSAWQFPEGPMGESEG